MGWTHQNVRKIKKVTKLSNISLKELKKAKNDWKIENTFRLEPAYERTSQWGSEKNLIFKKGPNVFRN